jgi:hypothetical protein
LSTPKLLLLDTKTIPILELVPLLGAKAVSTDEEMKITALNALSALLACNPEAVGEARGTP